MKHPSLVAAVSLFLVCGSLSSQPIRFDKDWWQHADEGKRWGFILGYLDCRQLKHSRHGNETDFASFMDGYLTQHNDDTRIVVDALIAATQHMPNRPDDPHAENWNEPHGYLNGGWWGDSKHGEEDEKTGFVEGYAVCAVGKVSLAKVKIISRAVDTHYDNYSREHDPIAEVIRPLLTSSKD